MFHALESMTKLGHGASASQNGVLQAASHHNTCMIFLLITIIDNLTPRKNNDHTS